MKNQLSCLLIAVLFFTTTSCHEGTGKLVKYEIQNDDDAYVMIQLKENKTSLDTSRIDPETKKVVTQIKSINTKLGYAEFAKKMASFEMDTPDGKTTYLVVRNFVDFKEAETYASAIDKELGSEVYGEIAAPFPISYSNYKSCIEEKDFSGYYKFYSKNR